MAAEPRTNNLTVVDMMTACKHERKGLVWTQVGSDGRPIMARTLRFQCPDCGCLFGSSAPHHMARRDTPEIDLAKLLFHIEQRDRFYALRRERLATEAEQRREQWRQEHSEYLRGEEWRFKRSLVMKRANWICEGCGFNRATQVHHLTYDHHGNEFLWELAAVCDDCHNRVHGHGDSFGDS